VLAARGFFKGLRDGGKCAVGRFHQVGLYSKAQYEQQLEAVEAAASCISAGLLVMIMLEG
jgi:hypothetical protein